MRIGRELAHFLLHEDVRANLFSLLTLRKKIPNKYFPFFYMAV